MNKITQGDLLNLFQLPILFPLSHTLIAGINLFGQTLLVLPFYFVHIRNVCFLYNFLTFFAYIASGYCAYRFAREWVAERWIAWVVGALYILMPYRVHNIPQLNLLFSFPIPLTLLFFSRFLKMGRKKDLVFFFLSLLSQFLFDLSLGLFLGIALGIFFLVQQIIFGLMPRRSWLLLSAAFVLFILSVVLIFLPYLSQETSFSIVTESKSISPNHFRTPLSFYSNWSYLLLFFKGIVWHQSPFCPGISIFIFFLLAFVPYFENLLQKTTALVCSVFLIVPALALPISCNGLPLNLLNRLCGWTLLSFLLSLSLLLFLIRKKIPRTLLLLTITWIILQFYSSQISLPFFNLFQGLARLFPVLLRARSIRTEYILLLLFFTVSAFGFSYFFRRFRKKKIVLALVLLLVFAERVRWPVHSEKFKDYNQKSSELYQLIAPYPKHFGLLELPFDPLESNFYALFTIYHAKHTYHGHIHYLKDICQLERNPRLGSKGNFSGLSDPQFIHMLKQNGIRLILIFKSRRNNEDKKDWYAMQRQIRLGANQSLYEKVEKTDNGTLLVLNEKESGAQIRYLLPHFSLRGKKNLVCVINAHGETKAEFLFNDRSIKTQRLQAKKQNKIVLNLNNQPLALQFNYLEIRSGPSLELIRVRIE